MKPYLVPGFINSLKLSAYIAELLTVLLTTLQMQNQRLMLSAAGLCVISPSSLCMIAFLSLGPAAGVARASAPRLPGSRDASPGVEADWPQCLPPSAAGCSAALPETSAVGDTDEWGSPGSQGQCTGGCTGFIRCQTKYDSCSAATSRRQIKLCEAIRLYQLSLPQSRFF